MPALMTWGGVALAVLGLLVVFLGLPDRAAGLSMGSDLLHAGATLFAGGLIVAALGQVLRGLHDVGDRVEEAGFGFGAPRTSFNDGERVEDAPMPLPRAGRNAPAEAEAAEPEEDYQTDPRVPPETRAARATVPPQPRAARTREPQGEPSRPPRGPAPDAARPSRQQPPALSRAPRDAAPEPADEFPEEIPQADGERREPRWLRAQAQAQAESQQAAGAQQAARPARGPASAPANPTRREPPSRSRPQQPEALPEEDASVSVVRSGIIGGMAYTLYSDGSIEAELPPVGTVRFNSLAELQEHVKRAGAEADTDFRGPTPAPH